MGTQAQAQARARRGVEGQRKLREHFLLVDNGVGSSAREESKRQLDEKIEQNKWQSVQHFSADAGNGPHSFTVSHNQHPALPLAKDSHLIPIQVAQHGAAARGRLQKRLNPVPSASLQLSRGEGFADDETQRRLRANDSKRQQEVQQMQAEEHARQQHEMDTYQHVNSKLTQSEEAQYNKAMEGAFRVWRDNMGTATQMHSAPPVQDAIPTAAPAAQEEAPAAPVPKPVAAEKEPDKAPEPEAREPEAPSNFTPVKIDVPVFSPMPKGLNFIQKK